MANEKREYSITDVSSSLASHLISAEANGANFVFSPLSLHVVLGLILAGSAGPTRDELLAYFKSESGEELNTLLLQHATLLLSDGRPLGGPSLSTVNGMWVDQSVTLKSDFKGIVEDDYKASCQRVDFKTKADKVREEVNAWATEKTNGLIKDILPPSSVNPLTRLILANAIYFKGIWEDKFDSSLTEDHKFYLMNGTSIKVPFMTSYDRQLISTFEGFKVLTLAYKQGQDKHRRFSMHFFLPDATDGLPALVEKFGSEVDFVNNYLPYKSVKVGKILVPKFKMEFRFEASKVLKGMGLVLPFVRNSLTEMVDSPVEDDKLHVSNIFHKSFIEVNEEGTEAAAVTVAGMICGCSGEMFKEPEVDFVADHPFIFFVREDVSGAVIFTGQVTNPNEKI